MRRMVSKTSCAALTLGAALTVAPLGAQTAPSAFTRADTLRGSFTSPGRVWWDVTFYDLHVAIHPGDSIINGSNGITYRVLQPAQEMQIDLMTPLDVDSMVQDGRAVAFRREGNAFFASLTAPQRQGETKTLTVYYRGKPRVAPRPPWDGGFTWTQDSLARPWVVTTDQGMGASVWWPNKDTQADEPDSQRIALTVPDPMINVSNGRLRSTTRNPDNTTTYEWFVVNPINNYAIAVAAGSYEHYSDLFQGEKGQLTMDFWPLSYHLDAAKRQFPQAKSMLQCFEHWFGPYPWYADGYKLIETPHPGMEHQSAVAYGNWYENGYRRRDGSGTGLGLKWDFIIVHESAHEWFANNITAKDNADMWVHESFANYAENLYTECLLGKQAGADYAIGTRRGIRNDRPIIPPYGVNAQGSGDMYPKGGNMLHTIRQIVGDDERWRGILRGLNQTFWHQTVMGKQVEDYISQRAGRDLTKVFDQYLRTTQIPVFEYRIEGTTLSYRWTDVVPGFDMPVGVTLSGTDFTVIRPTEAWQTATLRLPSPAAFRVDPNYYVIPREGTRTETSAKRPINVNDLFRLRTVRDVQVSPDGEWVAFVVGTLDSARDRSNSDLYMVSWDGSRTVQLTYTPDGESSPRWSPDGRYLSFVASRGESRTGGQIWLLDRSGGEAQKLTDLKSGVSDYQWSPDSKRIVIVAQDPDSAAQGGGDSVRSRTPKPIVIDRYHFKQDGQGYLGNRRSHLYLFDVPTKKSEQLTSGRYSENNPSWSPDGGGIAFVSERAADPDRVNDANIYVMDAKAGAEARQLTTWPGPDGGRPAWSPDGKWIAYVQGSEPQYSAYNLNRLTIVPADGGAARVLTAALDRPVSQPEWSSDGSAILGLVTDDRVVYPARVRISDGAVERLLDGRRVVSDLATSPTDRVALLAGSATQPNEIYAFERGTLRALTHENDAWLTEVEFGTTEDFSAKGKDGTVVNGLLVKPAGYRAGTKYPTLLRIHGGPNGQDQHAFNFERELFAANGYAVIAANYRGSAGRGAAYQKAIYADWGNKEVQDLLAAVDHVVAMGVADPDRLGIGGWSYGGILTDYTIATTTRFKAATSGAGSALQTSMYGVDQYVYQYDAEVGPPWKNQPLWEKISYPFWHADRIKTPTLFLGGEKDFNVPIAGGEQMYQALRSQGIETQLIVYPGQFHGIATPSYQKDRLERYLAWYAKYLKPPQAAASP